MLLADLTIFLNFRIFGLLLFSWEKVWQFRPWERILKLFDLKKMNCGFLSSRFLVFNRFVTSIFFTEMLIILLFEKEKTILDHISKVWFSPVLLFKACSLKLRGKTLLHQHYFTWKENSKNQFHLKKSYTSLEKKHSRKKQKTKWKTFESKFSSWIPKSALSIVSLSSLSYPFLLFLLQRNKKNEWIQNY